MKKRVIVIGAGPGGYVAAIRAAQLGAEVHVVESGQLGGTCLNVGCIPTKALLHTAELYRTLQNGALMGLKADNIRVDWNVLQTRKRTVVARLVKGVESLLKANGVTIYSGKAVLKDARSVELINTEKTVLTGDVIVLAVGSEPVALDFPGADLPGVIDSTAALSLPEIPKSMVIVGGGVIGVEFADLYSALGCEVTIVELLPQILPTMDGEIAKKIKDWLGRRGVTFLNEAKLLEVRQTPRGLTAVVSHAGKIAEITAQYVLAAVGRRPKTAGLGLEAAGIKTERGTIIVDKNFAASVPGIYAVGDCNGRMMLAHAASAQGVAAVEHALGHNPAYWANTIPACIYTNPEAAAVGIAEEQAKQQGLEYKAGKFALGGNGKAIIENGGIGLIKIIAGAKHGEILGVHIFGPRATDLIAEAALAIRLEATVDEFVTTIHAHPTVSEAMAEAALNVNGMAIHWPPNVRVQ